MTLLHLLAWCWVASPQFQSSVEAPWARGTFHQDFTYLTSAPEITHYDEESSFSGPRCNIFTDRITYLDQLKGHHHPGFPKLGILSLRNARFLLRCYRGVAL